MTTSLTPFLLSWLTTVVALVVVAGGFGFLMYDAGRRRGENDARGSQLAALTAATLHEANATAAQLRAHPCPDCGGHSNG